VAASVAGVNVYDAAIPPSTRVCAVVLCPATIVTVSEFFESAAPALFESVTVNASAPGGAATFMEQTRGEPEQFELPVVNGAVTAGKPAGGVAALTLVSAIVALAVPVET
jgi:hypothetical protein